MSSSPATQPIHKTPRELAAELARAADEGEHEPFLQLLAQGADPYHDFSSQDEGEELEAADLNDERSGEPCVAIQLINEHQDHLLRLALLSPPGQLGLRREIQRLLIYACVADSPRSIRVLAEFGADLNHVDDIGRTPLMRCMREETAQALLDLGAVAGFHSPTGACPSVLLHHCSYGLDDIVKVLLNHDVDIEAKNSFGETPLMAAAQNLHASTCAILISRGADLGAQDCHGRAALHHAVGSATRASQLRKVVLLLEAGADARLEDEAGRDACSYIIASAQPELQNSLRDVLAYWRAKADRLDLDQATNPGVASRPAARM